MIEEMFAQIRAEALAEIRPPGIERARRTVRRRRARAVAGTAVALVVALGLGWTALGRWGDRPPVVPPAQAPIGTVTMKPKVGIVVLDGTAGGVDLFAAETYYLGGSVTPQDSRSNHRFLLYCDGAGTLDVQFRDAHDVVRTVASVPCVTPAGNTLTTVDLSRTTGTVRFYVRFEAAGSSRMARVGWGLLPD